MMNDFSANQVLFPVLYDTAQALLVNSPRCHDWDHTLRVMKNADYIAGLESADRQVVNFAALLHDIGRTAEMVSNGRSCHAQIGAEKADVLLREAGLRDEMFIKEVCDCVRCHRYRNRSGNVPATIEAKVVYDADKLDSMGAIGIGRAFHFAGRVGARVHNSREEALAGEAYGLEDTAHREYLVKLARLKDCMFTRSGRRMAQERSRFMEAFFNRLERETEC